MADNITIIMNNASVPYGTVHKVLTEKDVISNICASYQTYIPIMAAYILVLLVIDAFLHRRARKDASPKNVLWARRWRSAVDMQMIMFVVSLLILYFVQQSG